MLLVFDMQALAFIHHRTVACRCRVRVLSASKRVIAVGLLERFNNPVNIEALYIWA